MRDFRRRPSKRVKRVRWLLGSTALVTLLGLGAATAKVFSDVYAYAPAVNLSLPSLQSRLAQPHRVEYANGSLLGFLGGEKSHREYVPIEQIPPHCLDSVVALEDRRFFRHNGVDVHGIVRAAVRTMQGRRQGGSTITQQLVKNLFELKKPRETNRELLARKYREAVIALQMERQHSKKKILEFYMNSTPSAYWGKQLHGIGADARYYFDTAVSSLDEIQCAFLAGKIHRPAAYNPFLAKDEQGAERIRKRAVERTRVVIDVRERYLLGEAPEKEKKENGAIRQHFASLRLRLAQEGIPFRRGEFSLQQNMLLSMIEDELANEDIQQALQAAGNPRGLRIRTSIDEMAQRYAQYALRHRATEWDVMLRGYQEVEEQPVTAARLRNYDMLVGTINEKINEKNEKTQNAVTVSFGQVQGTVDGTALERIVSAQLRYQKKRSDIVVRKSDIASFLESLVPGKPVLCSVKSVEGNKVLLDIEQRPAFRLAAGFQEPDGAWLIAVGSYDYNTTGTNYLTGNRGKLLGRQPGSLFKLFVQQALFAHNWEAVGAENELWDGPIVYPHYPAPVFVANDHEQSAYIMSPWFALVHSQNRFHVNALYHLLDKLSEERLLQLAHVYGFSCKPNEQQHACRERLQKEGIIFGEDEKEATRFEWAKARLLQEITPERQTVLRHFWHGQHAEELLATLEEAWKNRRLRDSAALEAGRQMLLFNEKVYTPVAGSLAVFLQQLMQHSNKYAISDDVLSPFILLSNGMLSFHPGKDAPGTRLSAYSLEELLKSRTLETIFAEENVHLFGTFTLAEWKRLQEYKQAFNPGTEWYSAKNVVWHPAGRLRLSLRIVQRMAQNTGIYIPDSQLVPALPLGIVSVTPDTLVRALNGLTRGILPAPHLIKTIHDQNNILLYRTIPDFIPVPDYNDAQGRNLLRALEGVVRYGTGKSLGEIAIDYEGNAIPKGRLKRKTLNGKGEIMPYAAGKTGTTNNFVDAWFLGLLAQQDYAAGTGKTTYAEPDNFLTGVTWAGEYRHVSMRRGSNRMYGSELAKLWGDIAEHIIDVRRMTEYFSPDAGPVISLSPANEKTVPRFVFTDGKVVSNCMIVTPYACRDETTGTLRQIVEVE